MPRLRERGVAAPEALPLAALCRLIAEAQYDAAIAEARATRALEPKERRKRLATLARSSSVVKRTAAELARRWDEAPADD